MWESSVNCSAKCTIKNNVLSCLRSEETLFNSDIYNYDDMYVVVCNEPRFGENYLNIAIYDDTKETAWPLVTIPRKLDTFIRRLGPGDFLVWTNSKYEEHAKDIKQCSFCHLHDNEKVDNITVDYHNLLALHILKDNFVLIEYMQVLGGTGGVEKKTVTTLTLYNKAGKALKILYEFYEGEYKTYSFELDEPMTTVTIKEKGGKPVSFKIKDLIKKADK